jgi:hypothetical protein
MIFRSSWWKLCVKYRLPIMLSDLEGKMRREAAAQLRWGGSFAWSFDY